MAISPKKFAAVSKKREFYSCQEADVEIRDYLEGCYEYESDFEFTPYWQLSQYEADLIAFGRNALFEEGHSLWYPETLGCLVERLKRQGKSAAARYIAARIYSGSDPDLASLAKDWVIRESILASVAKEEMTEIGVSIPDLQHIGIRFGWQARRFIDLYKLVRNPRRVWNSCYQVNKRKVLQIATTSNFNKLPIWVKKGLVLYAPQINTDRIGNIWRLPDCVKAWKYQPCLPKKIAEKVGRMSPRSRVIAAIAWKNTAMIQSWHDNKEFVRGLPDEALEIHPEWKQLNGLCAIDGAWEIEFPQSVATLKFWGQLLKNCVGGYGPAIQQRRSVVFAIKENGLITHCVEMNPSRRVVECHQFYKAGNGSPDPRIKREVLRAITS